MSTEGAVIEEEATKFEFDLEFQRKIAALFLRDTTFALQVKDMLQPDFMVNEIDGIIIAIVQKHIKTYRTCPDKSLLRTLVEDARDAKMFRKDRVADVALAIKECYDLDLSNPAYVADKVAEFARHRAIENAMLQAVTVLDGSSSSRFDKIGELMKQALSVGVITGGDDYDYFKEIEARTKVREDKVAGKMVPTGITTGYPLLDKHLYHMGWGRKELSCMMGPAKSGKSMSLGDFAKNASMVGHNVLYVSLEVAKEIIAERMDASFSNTLMSDLHTNAKDVERAVRASHVGAGHLKLRDFPSGSFKPSQLRRLLDGYRDEGINFDLVIVDYADIMQAEYPTDRLQDNLRSIYIDLRAIASEYNVAMLTATQTNRDGAKASTAKATDVGDDFNKVRTVDILIGINATDAEIAAKEARLYFAASRNTASGFSIKIKQDRERMRFITSVLGPLGSAVTKKGP